MTAQAWRKVCSVIEDQPLNMTVSVFQSHDALPQTLIFRVGRSFSPVDALLARVFFHLFSVVDAAQSGRWWIPFATVFQQPALYIPTPDSLLAPRGPNPSEGLWARGLTSPLEKTGQTLVNSKEMRNVTNKTSVGDLTTTVVSKHLELAVLEDKGSEPRMTTDQLWRTMYHLDCDSRIIQTKAEPAYRRCTLSPYRER